MSRRNESSSKPLFRHKVEKYILRVSKTYSDYVGFWTPSVSRTGLRTFQEARGLACLILSPNSGSQVKGR